MHTDPATWSSKHIELPRYNSLNAHTTEPRDPTKVWIAFLMDHGGYMTLLGLPALVAAASFISRMRWLIRNKKPHSYGRTNLIYWPSQIFIAIACLILIAGAIFLGSTSGSTGGLFLGTVFTLLAWVSHQVFSRIALVVGFELSHQAFVMLSTDIHGFGNNR